MHRYKLIFFVPSEMARTVANAVFATGAGEIGNYSQCCFFTEGVGQFFPNSEANPRYGAKNSLVRLEETKVEILCLATNIIEAVSAMKKAHPYEEVAYEVYKLEDY